MPSPKVIQLRQVLSEKFPGLRLRLEERPPRARCASRPPALEELLPHMRSKGVFNEIVAGPGDTGSATLIREMIRQAAARHQIVGLVDGADSFDVTGLEPAELAQLLWVRCSHVDVALKAADLLLRDGNLSAVILDLKLNPESQLRKIPAATWYRFQRLVEATATVCLVITPRALVASAKTRLTLRSDFSLADLWRDSGELLRDMHLDPGKAAQFEQAARSA